MNALRLPLFSFLATLFVACGGPSKPNTGESPAENAPAADKTAASETDAEDAKEPSDLDRPVDELFAAQCEHHIPQYTCDECRYEVGVAKVAPHLVDEGLVSLVHAEHRSATSPLSLTGEIAYDERRVVEVSSSSEGIIRRVFVTLGDSVKRGQALVEIDSLDAGEAQASFREAQSLLDLSDLSFQRVTALKDKGVSSEREVLAARQERDAARIRLDAARERLHLYGLDPQAADGAAPAREYGHFVLRAPQPGTVLNLHAVPGEIAHTEEPLAQIGDVSAVWVWANAYEQDVPVLRRAQARGPVGATITTRGLPDEVFTGMVDFISPVMDHETRTTRLRIALDNTAGHLMAGMFVQAVVHLPGSEDTLTLPRDAVMEDEGRFFVFVRHMGDYFVRRPVRVARQAGPWVEIADGVDEKAEIVAKGAFLLKSDVLRSKMGAGCAD